MRIRLLHIVFSLVMFVSATPVLSANAKPFNVAVSIYNISPVFMQRWLDDLKQHPAVLDGRVMLHVYNSSGLQNIEHLNFETISVMKHDAVIFVANDLRGGGRMIEMLQAEGVPVVASCAQTDVQGLAGFIGPDDVQAGFMTANAVVEKIGGHGNVVVLRGPADQGAAIHREVGIGRVLDSFPNVKELPSVRADWSRAAAYQSILGLIERNNRIDGIISHNDDMALGAINALKEHGLTTVPVASVDGIPEAMESVQRGELYQTLRQDSVAQSQGALDMALRELIGPDYRPESSVWHGALLEQWEIGSGVRIVVPWEVIRK